jgi:iron-sulfur cluster assembly protein
MKPLIAISEDARAFLAPKLEGFDGLLVTANKKGCAGNEYEFKPIAKADVTRDMDVTTDQGISIYFPKTMLMALLGSELVLAKDAFNTRLDFKNPNELSRCGCGESIQLPQ